MRLGPDLAEVARKERARIDWGRVHREADKRQPFANAAIKPNVGRWLTPQSRKRDETE